ncbi:interferon-activable protein 203-like isoform X2 [Neophocaena asiaeorientalis asiaeorientalis]|uniref:Interferon-activable protein 203-like isoform X2 n=1 Tax=Neophocaena asiaeorientalis asiaeorientalis TaxID=1706337 RepID=A0A341BTV7_NEOAA|nr:interferon-activable protein 203-like isoform X2 [Neophocaena asiaeorientalis asiaeorientalis]
MGSEFKRIVLLKGFQHISDYQFSMIKCLLAKDLRLTSKMQDEYDRIKIADLMEVKFPGSGCVDRLIDLIKDIEEIKDLAKTLRKEKLKVIRRSKAKEATPVKKSKLNKPSPDQSTSTTNKALGPESIKDTPVKGKKTTKTNESKRMNLKKEQSQLPGLLVTSTQSTESLLQTPQMLPPDPSSSSSTKKPRLKAVPKEASREEGFQRGPKEVIVLKATEPFTYDVRESERKMFHATVATESQFFQVKVYHVDLKEKFIPKKIIAISDYFGRNGFLEVFNASSVSDVNPDRKMEISKSLIQKANATPKISHLYSQALGTFVNGVFLVHKKLVCNECIYYEIQDNTGVMEVLVYGERLTRVSCEKGDRLTLICFELALSGDKRQLRSIIHSFIKVTKARKSKEQPFNLESYMET